MPRGARLLRYRLDICDRLMGRITGFPRLVFTTAVEIEPSSYIEAPGTGNSSHLSLIPGRDCRVVCLLEG